MKRLLTVLLAFVAIVGISYAQQPELIYQSDFTNKWEEWKSFDLDQQVLHQSGIATLEKYNGSDYDKEGKKAGWARISLGNSKSLIAISAFADVNAKNSDDWLISPEITLKEASLLQVIAQDLGYQNSLEIYVSETGDQPSDFTNKVATIIAYSSRNMITYTAFLDAPELHNKKLRIGIRHHNPPGGGIAVAAISVVNIPVENRAVAAYVENFEIPVKARKGVAFKDIPFTISNFGLKKITSFDIVIESPGLDAPIRHSYTTDLVNMQLQDFTIPETFAFNNVGVHELKVSIQNINGNNTPNAGNPKEIDFKLPDFEVFENNNSTSLTPLFEHFSASWCGPCAQTNFFLNPLYEKYKDKITVIKYQSDSYETSEGEARSKYYGVRGIPTIFLNGENYERNSYNLSDAGFKAQTYFHEHYEGYAEIKNQVYQLDKETKKVRFSMQISNYDPETFNSKNTNIRVALVEYTTYNNKSSNGETEFHNVFHEMMPNVKGIPFTSKGKDDFQHVTFEHTIKSKNIEDINNIGFVVFIQNHKDKTVLQSAWIPAGEISNVEEQAGAGIVGVYPNPTTDFVNVKYNVTGSQNVTAELVNAKGAVVGSYDFGPKEQGTYTNKIDATALPAGSYILNVKVGKLNFTNTLTVVR